MPALFVLLELLVATAKIPSEEQALVAGTWQNLSNLLLLDIYEYEKDTTLITLEGWEMRI